MLKVLTPKMRIRFEGWGRAVPAVTPLLNLEVLQRHPETADKPMRVLEKLAHTVDEQVGTKQRYCVRKPWEKLSDIHSSITSETLAGEAVEKCIASNASTAGQPAFDAFVLGSTTSARYTGSQATAVLGKCGLECPAFEIKAGCSTSLVSLQTALSLIQMGYGRVGVGCAETMSKVANAAVRENWFGLGDGAAAVRIAADENGPWTVRALTYGTDGRYVNLSTTPGILPPVQTALDNDDYVFKGDTTRMKEIAGARYLDLLNALLPPENGERKVHWLITHQVNRQLINEVLAHANISCETHFWSAESVGNLGGASILYTLAECLESGAFEGKGGGTLLMLSVGGGLSFAGQLWELNSSGAPA